MQLLWGIVILLSATVCTPALAQDKDPAALPLRTWLANGMHSSRHLQAQRRAHRPANNLSIVDTQLVVASASSPADLVLDGDRRIVLRNCWLRLHGDLVLKDRAVLELIDCRVTLENQRPKQFNVRFEGGELRTTRCVLGGTQDRWAVAQPSNFWLSRGTWWAKDTTVQFSGGILLGEGRAGVNRDAFLRGGTLIADGLHQGTQADAIILSGMGDVTLRNSTFNLHLVLYADGSTATRSLINLETERVISTLVMGDKRVHTARTRRAVTSDVRGLPYRLEVENSRIPFYFLSVFEVRSSGATHTYELQNTRGVIVGVHALDLSGAPRLTGDWAKYTSDLPQLPATGRSGSHEIPPTCGVAIGNVVFAAPKDDGARIDAWSFYLRGPGTQFTVQGPTKIAELFMLEGQLTLRGREAYDCRVVCNTVDLHRDARLTLEGVTLGGIGVESGSQGEILVRGRAQCTIRNAVVRNLTLRTLPENLCCKYRGENKGRIDIRDFVEFSPLVSAQSGSGTVTIVRASASENTDLTNLGFELPEVRNVASHWGATGVRCSGAAARPASGGRRATTYEATSTQGSLLKRLRLDTKCRVEVSAWVRAERIVAGARVNLVLRGSSGNRSSQTIALSSTWQKLHLSSYEVRGNDSYVDLGIEHSGASAFILHVDDFELRLAPWWRDDNFVNLDFDEGRARGRGYVPTLDLYPDYWETFAADAYVERVNLRPGARSGSQSIRLRIKGDLECQLYKDFSFLAPGQVVTFRGHVRTRPAQSGFPVKIHIGDGDNWWNGRSPNMLVPLRDPQAWTPFTIQYTVPANPSRTRFAITGGTRGSDIYVDDVSVTIR